MGLMFVFTDVDYEKFRGKATHRQDSISGYLFEFGAPNFRTLIIADIRPPRYVLSLLLHLIYHPIMFWTNDSSKKEKEELRRQRDLEETTHPVLMEIVSARDLSLKKSIDPYCIVRCGTTEVHRTKTIYNDPDPIWTVLTGSLCLLRIPKDNNDGDDSICVAIEVNDGSKCIGIVTVPYSEVLKCQGERIEYPLHVRPVSVRKLDRMGARLVLRFRRATREDLAFFRPSRGLLATTTPVMRASDINFKAGGEGKSIIQKHQKVGPNDNKIRYRTMPYPDPNNKVATEWLTRREIHAEALKPSRKWCEVGSGEIGKIFVEIIGCDKLPNLDIGVNDKTDPFVGIVFEDCMVRTDVIHDSLRPRWMPWCSRAFCFNVTHPSSLLLLGVFDYDEQALLDDHDPVGRVVISTANFQSHTSYLLHYALHGDPHMRDVSVMTWIVRQIVDYCVCSSFVSPHLAVIRNVDASLLDCVSNGKAKARRERWR
jgi:hypothetical protein